MKALTVRQPFAELIASGRKTIEVRSCRTPHRGPLVICAAKKLADLGPYRSMVDVPALERTLGMAVCIADLWDIRMLRSTDRAAACFTRDFDEFGGLRWAWFLKNVRRVKPVPVVGNLGVITLPDDVTIEVI